MTQPERNPYPYSDSNKRYMTCDWYLKARFGGKIARAALDQGCTCPNIDGTRGIGGCLFCKNGSASAKGLTLEAQYENGKAAARAKWDPIGFIPYFQAHTNTHGDPAALSCAFNKAAGWKDAVMIAVATRPDCVSEERTGSLARLARKIPLIVELGLQTSSDDTADRVNRCHSFSEFVAGYKRLKKAADSVNAEFRCESAKGEANGLPMKRFMLGIHIIDGLPGEDAAAMLKTARDTAALRPDMVKIHLLEVLRGTGIEDLWKSGAYVPMDREDYVKIVCDQLEVLPPDAVMGRVSADAPGEDLAAPVWAARKTEVANEIDKELFARDSWQGKFSGLL